MRPSRRASALGLLLLPAALAAAQASAPLDAGAKFELPSTDVLIDESIPIVVSGLPPQAQVTLRVSSGGPDRPWASSAIFTADGAGRVDLTRLAPVRGSYKGVDAMGLFWSAERSTDDASLPEGDTDESSPESWTLTAEIEGRVVARVTVRRRAVAASVRVTQVRELGLVGTFFEPADGARHPAFIVLSGSGGGIPPAAGPAGGLASHGYAVLALAYFRAERLPRTLSNIPLEYFGTALRWLSEQKAVDPERVGVLGGSRGAELALLLGVAYPRLRAVVAYAPSNVIWRGCCDATATVAWTTGGRPVAAMPPLPHRDPAEAFRAEIQVERIEGAVLLVSGQDDGVWPSSAMAEKVIGRLHRSGFKYPTLWLKYDHAGHAITRPYTSTMGLDSRRHPVSGKAMHLGGTPAGTAKAREDSWRQMLAFVDQHLRDAPASDSSQR